MNEQNQNNLGQAQNLGTTPNNNLNGSNTLGTPDTLGAPNINPTPNVVTNPQVDGVNQVPGSIPPQGATITSNPEVPTPSTPTPAEPVATPIPGTENANSNMPSNMGGGIGQEPSSIALGSVGSNGFDGDIAAVPAAGGTPQLVAADQTLLVPGQADLGGGSHFPGQASDFLRLGRGIVVGHGHGRGELAVDPVAAFREPVSPHLVVDGFPVAQGVTVAGGVGRQALDGNIPAVFAGGAPQLIAAGLIHGIPGQVNRGRGSHTGLQPRHLAHAALGAGHHAAAQGQADHGQRQQQRNPLVVHARHVITSLMLAEMVIPHT